jgi:hypothetical protein
MTHSTRTFLAHPSSLASAVSIFTLLLAGCGLQSSSSTAASPTAPITTPGSQGKLSGNVHGGQNPVSGAVIQLYAVGASGYTSAAQPLIPTSAQVVYNSSAPAGTTGALTDSNGSFLITGDYTCPTGSYVYITATGGNSGGGSNPNIVLMDALGPCSQLSSSTYIIINEVTTVAGAYALAQFSSGSTFGTGLSSQPGSASSAPSDNFATSAANLQGIANAMATASVLANNATGNSPGGNANGTAVPDYWQVNMIADILAACVNTTSPFTSCTTLYSKVNPVGGNAPADTLQAAVAMALSPSLSNCATGATCASTQIGTLFNLIPASAPFMPYPVTATQVNDMTIGITYNPVVPGGAASTVGSLTLSANPGGTGCTAPTVAFSGGGGSGATAVAALGTGATASEIVAVQVTNPGSGYTSTPTATISGCTTAPTLSVSMLAPTLLNNYADSINIDAYGNVWVGTQTHPIVAGTLPAAFVELDPTGNPIPNVASPTAVASSYQITSYKVGGTATTIFGQYSGTNLYGNFNGAFDTNNNFWFVDSSTGNSYASGSRGNLVGFPGSGAAYTTSGYTSGLHNEGGAGAYGYSMNDRRPSALAIDGSNNIWLQIVGGSATTNNIDQSMTVSSLSGLTNNGLYGVLGVTTPSATAVADGSPGTAVIFGGSNTEMGYQVLVDPNTGDKAGGAAIPGAPFAWTLGEGGLNPTGNNTDGGGKTNNLLGAAQGALFPYYTTASGLDYLGATINQGSYTPLSHNLDPDGVLTSNGISSSAGGFVPTITFPATGCATTPTASPVISSTGTISSVTLVSNGGSGCTTATGTAVTLTSTANDLPTTAATVTYTASGGVVTGLTVTAAGAGYGIETTPIGGTAGGTLTTKGGTTGTGVTSNVAFSSSDYFDFPMSNVWSGVFDSAGNLWMANGKSVDSTSALGNPALTIGPSAGTAGSMTKLNLNYGTAFTPAQFESSTNYNLYHSIAGMNAVGVPANNPTATAIDGGNNVYFDIYTPGGTATDTAGSAVGALSSSGTALSPTTPASGFPVAGFSGSCYWQSTVVNGAGTSCIAGPVSANQASPYHRSFTRAYFGIAVDGSGNIWYTTAIDNTQALTSTGANVVEIVGAAVPVVTPASVGLKNGTYGTKP